MDVTTEDQRELCQKCVSAIPVAGAFMVRRLGGLYGPVIAQRSAAPGKHSLASATANQERRENPNVLSVCLSEMKLAWWRLCDPQQPHQVFSCLQEATANLRLSDSALGIKIIVLLRLWALPLWIQPTADRKCLKIVTSV